MRRGVVFLASCLVLALAAPIATLAQNTGSGAGYFYPVGGSNTCLVATGFVCDGVRIRFEAPVPVYSGINSEATDLAFIYVGIFGTASGHGTYCSNANHGTNPFLLQFGIKPAITSGNAISYLTWWEPFNCENVQSGTALTINQRDTVEIQLLCTANCTSGNVNANWVMSWTNVTTSTTVTLTTTGIYTVWMDFVQFAMELTSSGTNSAGTQPLKFTNPIRFWNFQVHQNGAWLPVTVPGEAPPSRATTQAFQVRCVFPCVDANGPLTNSTMQIYSATTTVDTDNGPSFEIGSTVLTNSITTSRQFFPYSDSNSTIGSGP